MLFITITKGAGWLGCFSINLRPLSAAIGASCKESWSRVELGRHFILVTGVSAPQDRTTLLPRLAAAASVFVVKSFPKTAPLILR